MNDASILNVGTFADRNRLIVRPDDGLEPNAGKFANGDAANQVGTFGKLRARVNLWRRFDIAIAAVCIWYGPGHRYLRGA